MSKARLQDNSRPFALYIFIFHFFIKSICLNLTQKKRLIKREMSRYYCCSSTTILKFVFFGCFGQFLKYYFFRFKFSVFNICMYNFFQTSREISERKIPHSLVTFVKTIFITKTQPDMKIFINISRVLSFPNQQQFLLPVINKFAETPIFNMSSKLKSIVWHIINLLFVTYRTPKFGHNQIQNF